jgi:hypothetical protein
MEIERALGGIFKKGAAVVPIAAELKSAKEKEDVQQRTQSAEKSALRFTVEPPL